MIIQWKIILIEMEAKPKVKLDSLKPSIHFDDLELKSLCDNEELRSQFPQKLRSKWIKCLGLGKIYFPFSNNEHQKRSLDENTWKRLRLFLTTSDESLNVFCRLANNWKACSYHLRSIYCLQSNHDSIQLAKNPKYSPLHHKSREMAAKVNLKRHLIATEREDNIENMSKLYQIRCEHVLMSAHYMNDGAGGGGDSSGWLNRYNEHLFHDYHIDEDEEDEEKHRQEL